MTTTKQQPIRIAGFAVSLSMMLIASATAQITYVTTSGSFAPDGTLSRPYSLVVDATCGAPQDGEVRIQGGDYRQQGTYTEPARLTTAGGLVRIGDTPAESTTFRIVSYNVHLFGLEIQSLIDAVLDATSAFPIFGEALADWIADQIAETEWQDPFRASRIAPLLAAEQADVIGIQEMWDPGLVPIMLDGLVPADVIYENRREIETYTILGFDIPIPFALNSGLLMTSSLMMSNKSEITFFAEQEFMETLATKGYQVATIAKNGFFVGVFNVHTQSGDAADVSGTRVAQMMQLAIQVELYRQQHPSHAVIATGDFNVIGNSAEHLQQMYGALGSGLQLPFPLNAYHAATLDDAGPNLECSTLGEACTSCPGNGLRAYFNPSDNVSKRLDYFLYSDSLDGSARIMPTSYQRREYQVPDGQPTPCQDGWCTRDLSDHYGIVGDFKLYR